MDFKFAVVNPNTLIDIEDLRIILADDSEQYSPELLAFAINEAHEKLMRSIWKEAVRRGVEFIASKFGLSPKFVKKHMMAQVEAWIYDELISRNQLRLLEAYLAAHTVIVSVPDVRSIKSDGYAVTQHLPNAGQGLRATRFGLQSIAMDPTNALAKLTSNASVPEPISAKVNFVW